MVNRLFRPVVVFAMTFICAASYGQQRQWLLGVKGGIDIPNLRAGGGSDPVSQGWSSSLGPYFGIVGQYILSPGFSVQAELNYSSQGGKKNGKQAIPTIDLTNTPPPGYPDYIYGNIDGVTKLDYIELPILAKWSFAIGGRYKFFVNAGPYLGYLVAAKDKFKGTSNFYTDEAETSPILPQPISFDNTQDIKSDLKKFNVGVQAGIGMSVQVPRGNLVMTMGGNYGLIPVQKDKANGQNDTGAVNVTIGYLFIL